MICNTERKVSGNVVFVESTSGGLCWSFIAHQYSAVAHPKSFLTSETERRKSHPARCWSLLSIFYCLCVREPLLSESPKLVSQAFLQTTFNWPVFGMFFSPETWSVLSIFETPRNFLTTISFLSVFQKSQAKTSIMIVLTHSLDERRRWTCLATAWLDSSDISSSHLESSARTLPEHVTDFWRPISENRFILFSEASVYLFVYFCVDHSPPKRRKNAQIHRSAMDVSCIQIYQAEFTVSLQKIIFRLRTNLCFEKQGNKGQRLVPAALHTRIARTKILQTRPALKTVNVICRSE